MVYVTSLGLLGKISYKNLAEQQQAELTDAQYDNNKH